MMKKITFLFAVLISITNIYAQNNLWPSEAVNTGTNATYVVNNVTFNGSEISEGKVGAFFINDLGNYECGGWQVWDGNQTSISVVGDDSTTEEKDGFENGDNIVWLGTTDNGLTTYEASVTFADFMGQPGSPTFIPNSINVVTNFVISNTVYCVNDADGDGICDENEMEGCTDSTAFNYNSEAEIDDGSCIETVLGCTDSNADNYNPAANTDDGTCTIAGCMNEEAQNYNELANVDDGSCLIEGCMNSSAFNYNSSATLDDNSCLNLL